MKKLILLLAAGVCLMPGTVRADEKFRDIDRTLDIAFEHARNYPPEFTSEAQREDLESRLRDTIARMERMMKDSRPQPEVLFRLGKASAFAYNLDMPGSKEKADEYFKQLFELEPDHAQGHLYYGQHLSGRGEFDAAVPHLQVAADAGVDTAFNMLGLAYMQMGQVENAKACFQKLFRKYPESAQLRMLLDSLDSSGEYEYKLMRE